MTWRSGAVLSAFNLLARGWADLAPIDGQDDCFAVGEVNQQALFGRVAAVVHHGGAGTTTTATLAGAPQVVVPQWADQPYWASRVADLGIGAAHDVQAPTTGSLSAALRTALTPKTRARAAAVAGTIRTDGATVAARLLLDAVSRQRPPCPREPPAGACWLFDALGEPAQYLIGDLAPAMVDGQ